MSSLPERGDSRAASAASEPGRALERKVRLSLGVIFFERVWRTLLWPFAVAGLFLLLSLLDVWTALPGWAHKTLIGVFAIAALASLAPLFRVRWPSREEALRRLERDSGIKHRPATSYEDKLPAGATAKETALWEAHRQRISRLLDRLKVEMPRPRLAEADPYALRAALLLLLAIAFAASGRSSVERMGDAFALGPQPEPAQFRLDAWVTPPLYTAKPPVVLADGTQLMTGNEQSIRDVTVPERSVLIVRINSKSGSRPALETMDGEAAGSKPLPPLSDDGRVREYKVALTEAKTLAVRAADQSLTTWVFNLIEDAAPTVQFVEEPFATPRGALQLNYHVEDDYGVAHAEARFALAEEEKDKIGQVPQEGAAPAAEGGKEAAKDEPLFPAPVVPLTLPRANAKLAEGKTYKDLTGHPWAGLKVKLKLVARDQAGQEGESETHELVLPARKFNDPLARAVVEQRLRLVRKPSSRPSVAQALSALTLEPDRFIEDKVVYLGLRTAYWRLEGGEDRDTIVGVVDLLWDIALRIEDGDLPEAERALQAAQERLQKALEEGAPDSEIQRLINELRQALADYLNQLAERAQQNGMLTQIPEGLGQQQMLNAQDLDQLLKKIEELSKSGAKDLAQRLLSELKDMLQRLQMGQFARNSRAEQMMNSVEGLGEIIKNEQQLLDDTFKAQRGQGQQGQEGQEGQQGEQGQQGQRGQGQGQQGRYGQLMQRQGDIRGQLDALLEQLRSFGAQPPDQLDGAGQAMNDAEQALDEGNLDRATQQQTLALDRLRQGTQQLAEQVLQQMMGRLGRSGNAPRDPLGRPERTRGPDLGTSVKVPDEIDIQRAREILEELRRRLGEPTRPLFELEYLERLLRQY